MKNGYWLIQSGVDTNEGEAEGGRCNSVTKLDKANNNALKENAEFFESLQAEIDNGTPKLTDGVDILLNSIWLIFCQMLRTILLNFTHGIVYHANG